MKENEYPIRINRYLALKNYSTRRGGDELIEKGRVFINGKKAALGDKVNENDVVEVTASKNPKKYVYFAYNKPRGVTTHSPQEGERDIKESTPLKDVFPIGRLDKNSSGLIILTNDGRVTDRLLNPEYTHDKEYIVKTEDKLRPSFKKITEAGVDIEGYRTKESKVDILNDFTFRITLTEEKKHQIRRMCSALHHKVRELKRIRIMNIKLSDLPVGAYRQLEGKELTKFLKGLGL